MKKKSWSWSSPGSRCGRPALVDLVGGGGDHRARRLAEDLGEADDGRDPRLDQVLEGLARADRRQLVGVADEDDVGRLGQAAEQDLDQAQVEHRGLVDDHQVDRQRVARLEGGLAARAPLEQAVDRLSPSGRSPPRAGGRRGRWGRRGRSAGEQLRPLRRSPACRLSCRRRARRSAPRCARRRRRARPTTARRSARCPTRRGPAPRRGRGRGGARAAQRSARVCATASSLAWVSWR